jgi:uncharacterized membrane protein YkoI
MTNMKKASLITGMVIAGLIALGGTAISAEQANPAGSIKIVNKGEADFASMAKVSMGSAINAALGEVQGKVLRAELENENGYLVYGIEIVKTDHQIVDVKIDAGDGKILKVDKDRKDKEDHEREGHENKGDTDSGMED